MARYRGTVQGSRGQASRLGTEKSGIQSSTNGWDLGVSVTGHLEEDDDTDAFVIEITGGSNQPNTVYSRILLEEDEDCVYVTVFNGLLRKTQFKVWRDA